MKMNSKRHVQLLLLFLCFFILNCPVPGENSEPVSKATVTISSPEYKYYTTDTILTYSTTNASSIEIRLDGNIININSGDTIPGLITGSHTIEITAEDSDGIPITETVRFFINKLTLSDSDNFDREDSTAVGGIWDVEADQDEIMEIDTNHLVSIGCFNVNADASVIKLYDGSIKSEVLQKIDILNMSEDTTTISYLILRDVSEFNNAGDYFEQVQAEFNTVRENGEFIGYKLMLSWFGMEWGTWTTSFGVLAESETLNIDFTNPVTMLYYKNGDDYTALLYDNNQNILAYVHREDYTITDLDPDPPGFTHISIQLMPYDSSGTADILITVDNYEYY